MAEIIELTINVKGENQEVKVSGNVLEIGGTKLNLESLVSMKWTFSDICQCLKEQNKCYSALLAAAVSGEDISKVEMMKTLDVSILHEAVWDLDKLEK
ncbi:hypothetical protein [uncultured Draconibacterium sp.]|uniref:hypothetical protein n=1 Tax=uncultured Draconibacterium sp. TaxID=1573823 RepID=UPI0025E62F55|nr:hypothetical protein [uncultured Draconibacterium sp.]